MKFLLFAGKWMELENTTLSEAEPGSESQRPHVFSYCMEYKLNINTAML
jgi:hypothetical protein